MSQVLAALLCLAAVTQAVPLMHENGASLQYRSQDNLGNYAFGYEEGHPTGGSFRKESGSAGVKVGSYGLKDADGRYRIVNYVADSLGFRADIQTNEPGVEPKNPADVSINKASAVLLNAAPLPVAPAAAVTVKKTPAVLLHAAPLPVAPAAAVTVNKAPAVLLHVAPLPVTSAAAVTVNKAPAAIVSAVVPVVPLAHPLPVVSAIPVAPAVNYQHPLSKGYFYSPYTRYHLF